MRLKIISVIVITTLVVMTSACSPGKKDNKNSFSGLTRGLDRVEGFFDIYIDRKSGKIYARLPKPDETGLSVRMIHANSINAGLGSNPVGLDRGLTTSGQILAFRAVGGKAIAEVENWKYRASADDIFEKQSVQNSFAKSYLWAGPISARASDGDLLVDISEFLTLDLMDIRGRLKNTGQGNFALNSDLSLPDVGSALAFPDNIELDGSLTFTSDAPGQEVRSTASFGRSFTLSLHHSFVRLPDDGYKPRAFDPRTAAIDVPYYDYSADLAEPIVKKFARRFRLERESETAASGPVKKPIIFYVDRGAPEPVRSALIDGASWWADAFADAGFEDAYRVEVLPEDAHPLDIRYNVIQWTHRQTRGWSYGGGIYDPRTGEMLKAHVILGSQRVRQDRMIFEGLAGVAATGSGRTDDPLQIALARIRQLSAHEVGHTLGFAHNFAASTIDRASVMDYPAPDVQALEGGRLDFSQAYDSGIGEWDKFTTRWLYTQFAPEVDEKEALNNIVERGYEQGLRFVSDAHARSLGAAHPEGSLWDNGADPVEALDKTMRVRQIALRNFDLSVIQLDTPRARLRDVLVPVYLYHRYQVEAAAKLIGGYRYNYSVNGDGLSFSTPVTPERQRGAIEGLLKTLDPEALDLPERILVRLSPPVGGFNSDGSNRETFSGDLREVFDPLEAADASTKITLNAILQPQRLARLIETNRRSTQSPGYEELLAALNFQIFDKELDAKYDAISRRIQTRFVSSLLQLARGTNLSPEVRAETDAYLLVLQTNLSSNLSSDNRDPDSNHRAWLLTLISSHLNRDNLEVPVLDKQVTIPPGSPIGTAPFLEPDFLEDCWHCESRL